MKRIIICFLATLISITSSGCTSSRTPEQLINKPIYNKKQEELYKNINQILPPKASLILPSNSSEVGTINKVDLNNDGIKEVIAFEKKEESYSENNEIGFMILNEEKQSYKVVDSILEKGTRLEYANFYDLNNDGTKEIILIWSIADTINTKMSIYNFNQNEIEKIYNLNHNWLPEEVKNYPMKIKIGHLDNDNIVDIVLFNYNGITYDMYASLCNFDTKLNLVDNIKLKSNYDISESYITLGSVSSTKKGIMLDIPLTPDSYYTQIIYKKEDKLEKVFDDYYAATYKSYYISSQDINNNDVLDIPVVTEKNNYRIKNSSTVTWYEWNNKNNENNENLRFTSQIYYNYNYNIEFRIPSFLVNKLRIEEEYKGNNVYFKFYYLDPHLSQQKNIFTIGYLDKNTLDDTQKVPTMGDSSFYLAETDTKVFMGVINKSNIPKSIEITQKIIKNNFKLIY
jgi:hypothetical protein